jgi:hypothetical protein
VSQGFILGPLLFILFIHGLWRMLLINFDGSGSLDRRKNLIFFNLLLKITQPFVGGFLCKIAFWKGY